MRAGWLLALAACSGAAGEPRPSTKPDPIGVRAAPPPSAVASARSASSADVDALRARVGKSAVFGRARLVTGARLFSSASRTSSPAPPPSPRSWRDSRRGDLVEVLEDLGESLRVKTRVFATPRDRGASPWRVIDDRFELEGFVARSALSPVLTKPKRTTFDDGTGFVLREGLGLGWRDGNIVVVEHGLTDLPAAIDASDVGLAFSTTDDPPALPALAYANLLGCPEAAPPGLQSEISRARSEADRAAGKPTFTLGQRGYSDDCRLREGTRRPRVDGHVLGVLGTFEPCRLDPRVVAHRTDADEALLTVELAGVSLRLRGTTRDVERAGGCGSGSLGRQRERYLIASRGSRVFYQDGTAAGSYVGPDTLVVGKPTTQERVCMDVSWVDGGLCFVTADLVEEER